jgi:hypothetical protein
MDATSFSTNLTKGLWILKEEWEGWTAEAMADGHQHVKCQCEGNVCKNCGEQAGRNLQNQRLWLTKRRLKLVGIALAACRCKYGGRNERRSAIKMKEEECECILAARAEDMMKMMKMVLE